MDQENRTGILEAPAQPQNIRVVNIGQALPAPDVHAALSGLFPNQPASDVALAPDRFHDLEEYNSNILFGSIDTPPSANNPITLSKQEVPACGSLLTFRLKPVVWDSLNYSSLGDLILAKERVPLALQSKIDILEYKACRYQNKYPDPDYFPQCSLVSMLEQNLSYQVCFCGLKSRGRIKVNPSALCSRPRLCMQCAHQKARETLKTFLPKFHFHQWSFLTISSQGSLPFTHTSGADWCRHWDAAKFALNQLVRNELVEGAMIREELAITSLSPTSVQPHVHAIVPTDAVSEGAIERLTKWVKAYCDDMGENISLEPSIVFKPINQTEEDFERVVHYIHKPIDLVTPYRTRWPSTGTAEEKIAVNREMRNIMEAYLTVPVGRHQIYYLGNMRARSKRIFIGVPVKDRV